jgi:DNA polymerase
VTKHPGARPPSGGGIAALREAARGCHGCELYERGTQTVFGEGPARAKLLLVGEQPGDREDVEGRPFVGAAGAMLDRALEAVGLDRRSVYVTNAVKHFKWEPRGKRRLHSKPNRGEMLACRPWLEAEIAAVRPHVIVCLGSTAAQALLGAGFRVTHDRGKPLASRYAAHVVATVHPSAILRAPDPEAREKSFHDFVADLRVARRLLAEEP